MNYFVKYLTLIFTVACSNAKKELENKKTLENGLYKVVNSDEEMRKIFNKLFYVLDKHYPNNAEKIKDDIETNERKEDFFQGCSGSIKNLILKVEDYKIYLMEKSNKSLHVATINGNLLNLEYINVGEGSETFNKIFKDCDIKLTNGDFYILSEKISLEKLSKDDFESFISKDKI